MTLLVLAAAGCAAKGPARPGTTPVKSVAGDPAPKMGAPVGVPLAVPSPHEPFANAEKVALVEAPQGIQVDIYQLSVPYGTVSRNEKFWKRIDEQCVDITTHETLFKNGIRVGEAPTSEWDYFKKVMQDNPTFTRVNSMVSPEGRTVELPVRKQVDRQTLFYFDSAGVSHGRSFDASENLMTMVLQPAPRKSDTVRLTLCPVVRAVRRRLTYSPLNREEAQVHYTRPERIYDLNLRADVPLDSFFVVAPSGEATWPTSVGNNFLVSDGPAERMETVLLLVPHAIGLKLEPASPLTPSPRHRGNRPDARPGH